MSKYLEESIKSGVPVEQIIPIETEKYSVLVEKLREQKRKIIIPTGFKKLDDIVGGFEGGRLYILSAPTKMGKTTMAQTIMYKLAQAGMPSLFFSYEMSWQEVVRKYMAMDNILEKGDPTDLPMYIPMDLQRGGGELQFQWLYESIMRFKEKVGFGIVVIDHLHFLLPLRDYSSNISFLIGGIVREIKKMAVTTDTPIILIAHVGMIKDDRIPTYRDIRDSSFITQEADTVFMMYRKKSSSAARTIKDDNEEETYTNEAFFSVELDRVRGNTGKIKLLHNGVMFEEFSEGGIIKKNNTFIPYA
jgi:replicative DNA helicase